jgi:hypothetical protein
MNDSINAREGIKTQCAKVQRRIAREIVSFGA